MAVKGKGREHPPYRIWLAFENREPCCFRGILKFSSSDLTWEAFQENENGWNVSWSFRNHATLAQSMCETNSEMLSSSSNKQGPQKPTVILFRVFPAPCKHNQTNTKCPPHPKLTGFFHFRLTASFDRNLKEHWVQTWHLYLNKIKQFP